MPEKPLRFDLIDPLRAFAALSILVYHSIAQFEWKDFPVHFPFIWFHWAWMAVDIFFVLSGFVITLAGIKLYNSQKAGQFRKAFLLRRARRIVPLYYLTLAFFIAVMYCKGQYVLNWEDIWIHLAFLHPFYRDSFSSINGVNWSVGVEMHFYILFAIIFPFLKRSWLIWLLCLFPVTAWLWRFLAWQMAEPGPIRDYYLFTDTVQLPGMLDEFCLGMLAGFFAASPWIHKLQASRYARWLLLALFCAASYILSQIYMRHAVFWDNPWMVIFFRSGLALDFTLLLLFFCSFRLSALARKILAPFVYLGTISYGIYLFHLPVLLVIKDLPLGIAGKFLAALAATIALAALSWHFYERRFLR